MTPQYIIIHHTAVSRVLNKNQFDAVKRYHIGLGWGNIGYHYLIEPNGLCKKGRRDNEVGAHCKEKAMNFKSLGICLTGNFDIEKPTDKQIYVLRDLLQSLTSKFRISAFRIFFHRDYAPYKSCPGKNLDRGFVRNLTIH